MAHGSTGTTSNTRPSACNAASPACCASTQPAFTPPPVATSFVIVDPEARAELDRSCLAGRGWWGDEWWDDALRSGLFAIENHSWDHHHDSLPRTVTGLPGGRFDTLADHAAADAEV